MRRLIPLLMLLALISAACRIESNLIAEINVDGSGEIGAEIGYDEEAAAIIEQFTQGEDPFANSPMAGMPGAQSREENRGDMHFLISTAEVEDIAAAVEQSMADPNSLLQEFSVTITANRIEVAGRGSLAGALEGAAGSLPRSVGRVGRRQHPPDPSRRHPAKQRRLPRREHADLGPAHRRRRHRDQRRLRPDAEPGRRLPTVGDHRDRRRSRSRHRRGPSSWAASAVEPRPRRPLRPPRCPPHRRLRPVPGPPALEGRATVPLPAGGPAVRVPHRTPEKHPAPNPSRSAPRPGNPFRPPPDARAEMHLVFLDLVPLLLSWEGRGPDEAPEVPPGAAEMLEEVFADFRIAGIGDGTHTGLGLRRALEGRQPRPLVRLHREPRPVRARRVAPGGAPPRPPPRLRHRPGRGGHRPS